MNDDSVERQIQDLDQRAQDVGITLSPELKRDLQEKLAREAQQKTELTVQQQAIGSSEPMHSNQSLSLRREIISPGDNVDKPALQENRTSAEERLQATDSNATVQPYESQVTQPLAVGEHAMIERAETGPEKKDKEIYLADKRLSRL